MITIPLSTEDLTKVRLVPSPLWETVNSFRVLLHHGCDSAHAPWAARARRALLGTDLAPLVAAMCLENHCPDFISPPPDATVASFGDELERLGATPPDTVFEEFEEIAQVEEEPFGHLLAEKERLLGTFLGDPEGSLKKLVDALKRYHDLVISPHWLRIREHVEADTLSRGQVLAIGGVEALLSGLHPKVGYAEGVLTLEKDYETVLKTGGRGITLVPCSFVWPRVAVLVRPGYRTTLAYPPRGAANLWISSSAPNGTALGAALGDSRASVLKGLLPAPTTTMELSQQLGLAPAAVSSHLSRLKVAGLVEPHRSGRKVYYRLSFAGGSLLEIFGEIG